MKADEQLGTSQHCPPFCRDREKTGKFIDHAKTNLLCKAEWCDENVLLHLFSAFDAFVFLHHLDIA